MWSSGTSGAPSPPVTSWASSSCGACAGSLRPEIVHLNSSKAGVLGRIAGAAARVPIRVFTVHGWAHYASSGFAGRLYLWADRLALPLTTAFVCVSEADRKAGIAARTCTDQRAHVIHNGVEPGPEPTRAKRHRVRIVSVGRLAAQKDFPTLIRAAMTLDPTRAEVTVLGDGPDRPAIEAEIARLGLTDRVTLAGEVDDVPDRLRNSDVFVLSSNFEGLPISVLEAMAAGLPIVASNVGGLPELVEEGGNGTLVRPGDSEELSYALAALVDDPALRLRQGDASRRRVLESFSIDACRAAHRALYDGLRIPGPLKCASRGRRAQGCSEDLRARRLCNRVKVRCEQRNTRLQHKSKSSQERVPWAWLDKNWSLQLR